MNFFNLVVRGSRRAVGRGGGPDHLPMHFAAWTLAETTALGYLPSDPGANGLAPRGAGRLPVFTGAGFDPRPGLPGRDGDVLVLGLTTAAAATWSGGAPWGMPALFASRAGARACCLLPSAAAEGGTRRSRCVTLRDRRPPAAAGFDGRPFEEHRRAGENRATRWRTATCVTMKGLDARCATVAALGPVAALAGAGVGGRPTGDGEPGPAASAGGCRSAADAGQWSRRSRPRAPRACPRWWARWGPGSREPGWRPDPASRRHGAARRAGGARGRAAGEPRKKIR